MGGMVVETNQSEIMVHVEAQSKLEKSESNVSGVVKVRMYMCVCVCVCVCG